eukprot:m.255173 g.255173  ORF g.255173 m.255173 type:complete len:331 (+) comp19610_c0_seq2:85-1077(+)
MFSFNIAVLAVGVWVTFMLYGYAIEAIKVTEFGTDKERFKDTSFLIFIQGLTSTVVSALVLLVRAEGSFVQRLTAGVPQTKWLPVSIAFLGAGQLGLGALNYITYPVQVLLKCCKPIPVVFGEMIIARKKHTPAKLLSVLLLVVGVAIFMFNKPSKKSADTHAIFEWTKDSAYGLLLVFGALVCDGVYGPGQTAIKAAHPNLRGEHNMFTMNLHAMLFTLASTYIWGGGFSSVVAFVTRHPSILPMMLNLVATMALGNLFIYKLQTDYGALTVTTITTLRKLFSILFSVLWFGHATAPLQWAGVLIVVLSDPISKTLLPPTTSATDKKTK